MLGIPLETTQLCYICGLKDEGWEFNWQPLVSPGLCRADLWLHSAALWQQPKQKLRMLDSLFRFEYPEPTAASPN